MVLIRCARIRGAVPPFQRDLKKQSPKSATQETLNSTANPELVVSQKKGPQVRPQSIIVLILVTPKTSTPDFGKP